MRILIAASDVFDALKQSAYARSTPLDAIKHVLVETLDDGHVAIEATDMTARTRITLPGEVVQPGAALLEADKLLAIASGGGELSLSDTGHATRGRSRFQLSAMPPADFPRLDEAGFIDAGIDPEALAAGIAQVEHAADDKDVRPYCRCVFLAHGRLSAGNGRVISSVAMPGDAPVLMIPVAQVRHLHGLLHKESRITLGNVREAGGLRQAGLVRVEAGNTVVTISCVESAPFDVGRLVDSVKLPSSRIVFKRKPLMEAVRRFSPFVVTYGKGDVGVVLQSRDGQVRIADGSADAPNSEDVTEHVSEATGPDFTVGLAHRYILSVLSAMDADEVDFYPDPRNPNLFLPRGAQPQQVAHLVAPQALKA